MGEKYFGLLCGASPNLIIRFVAGVLSVSEEEGEEWKGKLERLMVKLIVPMIGSNGLIE